MNYRMLNYPESLVAHYTGILNQEKCAAILESMWDACGGLSHLGAMEFRNACEIATKELFPEHKKCA